MTTIQDRNPEQGVPAWLINRLGKLVQTRSQVDEFAPGRRGVLLRICSKAVQDRRQSGVYCTVAFDLADIGYESNVEISQLQPVDLVSVRG